MGYRESVIDGAVTSPRLRNSLADIQAEVDSFREFVAIEHQVTNGSF